MLSFREKWLAAVEKKNSILCAGLDPAEFLMGRGEKGLPAGTDKLKWAFQYIRAVAPYCSSLKSNIQYWKNAANLQLSSKGGMQSLLEIAIFAHEQGLVVIDDSKLADIGETNDAGVFYAVQKEFDAVTFSPFAGNMQEAAGQAHARGLGLISMCLMSNKEYEREKNKWVNIEDDYADYATSDVEFIEDKAHTKQYIQLAHDARKFGVDGIVVGAPSSKNHIKDEEISRVARYFSKAESILVPGIGAQGGEVISLSKYFNANNLICNVGRGLMFPNGAESTSEQQAKTAKTYRDMLNSLRTAV